MEKLADIIDAILAQGMDNEIKVSVSRNKNGWIQIVITDNFGEICNSYELFVDGALHQAFEQLQSFVEDQVADSLTTGPG